MSGDPLFTLDPNKVVTIDVTTSSVATQLPKVMPGNSISWRVTGVGAVFFRFGLSDVTVAAGTVGTGTSGLCAFPGAPETMAPVLVTDPVTGNQIMPTHVACRGAAASQIQFIIGAGE